MRTKRPLYCTCIHNSVLVCGLTLTDQSSHGAFLVPIQTNTVNKYYVKKSQLARVRPVGYSQSRAKELSFVNICSNKAFVSKQPRLKQLLRFSCALQTSRVLHIPKLARWLMNQLLNFISFVTTGR